jgi:hypothetical protein
MTTQGFAAGQRISPVRFVLRTITRARLRTVQKIKDRRKSKETGGPCDGLYRAVAEYILAKRRPGLTAGAPALSDSTPLLAIPVVQETRPRQHPDLRGVLLAKEVPGERLALFRGHGMTLSGLVLGDGPSHLGLGAAALPDPLVCCGERIARLRLGVYPVCTQGIQEAVTSPRSCADAPIWRGWRLLQSRIKSEIVICGADMKTPSNGSSLCRLREETRGLGPGGY